MRAKPGGGGEVRRLRRGQLGAELLRAASRGGLGVAHAATGLGEAAGREVGAEVVDLGELGGGVAAAVSRARRRALVVAFALTAALVRRFVAVVVAATVAFLLLFLCFFLLRFRSLLSFCSAVPRRRRNPSRLQQLPVDARKGPAGLQRGQGLVPFDLGADGLGIGPPCRGVAGHAVPRVPQSSHLPFDPARGLLGGLQLGSRFLGDARERQEAGPLLVLDSGGELLLAGVCLFELGGGGGRGGRGLLERALLVGGVGAGLAEGLFEGADG